MDFEVFRKRKVKEELAGALLGWPVVVLGMFAIGYGFGDLLEREQVAGGEYSRSPILHSQPGGGLAADGGGSGIFHDEPAAAASVFQPRALGKT